MSGRRYRCGVWLRAILDDLAAGTHSVLEHGFLTLVEQPHGLPTGVRQVSARSAGRVVIRDVEYAALRLIIELDGKTFHDNSRARDRDFDRDLDAAVDAESLTVRLTYGQVFGTPCRTADRLAALMRRRGWEGTLRTCPDCPE